jgi:SPP1 family holin
VRKVKPDTIIRTIVLILALINQFLAIYGREASPITDDEVYQAVTLIVTIGSSIWAWWKNNSFSAEAIAGDDLMNRLREEKRNDKI